MELRNAKPGDLPAIVQLLAQAKLPTEGVAGHLTTFFVAEDTGTLAGVVGLELLPSGALLRSLAVEPAHRGKGLATRLCDHLEAQAAELGVQTVFLLTETARDFFARRGYIETERDAAPPDVAGTAEFSHICPQSAVFMQRAAPAPVLP